MDTKIYTITDPENQQRELREAAALLRAGETVAIPTETVYGLAANALDPDAVKKIFEAKGRPQDNPLIVHIAQTETLYEVAASVPNAALRLAQAFWPGPLTIILPKKDTIPDEVSAGLDTVAVRLPSHPVARAIIKAAGIPLAAPSANISGFPSPTDAETVRDDMMGRVAAIVDGGACNFGIESTVITLAAPTPRLLRPGAVTVEQLEAILGKVEVDDAVLRPLQADAVAASPGMKYKHYAPKAQLSIIKGDLRAFAAYVYRNLASADHCLCFEGDERFLPLPAVTIGKEDDPLSQSHRLFDALRQLDRLGAKTVLARQPQANGVGLGVCNRLYRAAGFRLLGDRPEQKTGKIIGLCGLSGAGKTSVCDLLRMRGAEIIDTDKIAREIVEKGAPVLEQLTAAFGKDVLFPDGSLDRKALAAKAFSDAEGAKRLSAITHPAIIRKTLSAAFAAADAGNLAVIDAPLLFTAGLDRFCDLTAVVSAPEPLRRQRIRERDGISDEAITKRFAAQEKEAEKAAAADVTVRNYPPYDLRDETDRLLGALC